MPMADGYIVPYNLTTVSQQFDGGMEASELTVSLQHFVFSIAVQNLSADKSAVLYISKYTNDSVIIPPSSYKEIAVTTDWYRLEFEEGSDADDKVIVDRVETEDPDFLMTPLFPNLFQTTDTILDTVNQTYTPTDEVAYFVVTKLTPGTVSYSYEDSDDVVTGPIDLEDESFTTTDPYGNVSTVVKTDTFDVVQLTGVTLKSFTLTTSGSVKVSLYSNRNYNPINAGGYTYTPWSISDGSNSVAASDTVVKVDYYLNGVKTSTSSGNFYSDFANSIFEEISSYYPEGYDPTNPQYDPAQFANIVSKTRTFFDSIRATSVHDQYIGGWATMTDYNKELALYEFTLDGATPEVTSIELPFTALGFTVQRVTGTTVTFDYEDSFGTVKSSSVASNTPLVINDSIKSIVLTSADKLKVTFSGNLLKLIDFAPVINIVYPLGFDQVSGTPSTDYQSFSNALDTFEANLETNKFTGRVLYFRAVPFSNKEPADVWNADYIIPTYLPKDFKLVFKDLQADVYNWYMRSNMETDLLKVIAWENRDIYYEDGNPEPASLDEVIQNSDVHTILGQTVPLADPETFKLNVLKKFLLNEYNGPYSMGGLNFFRFGFTV